MNNFRDLGGCKTLDGRSVKKGIFFRSAHLANLSQEDKDYLKSLNIKNIFDFRSEEEEKKNPTPKLENITNTRITAMNITSGDGSNFGSVEDMIKSLIDSDKAFTILKDGYYNLPVDNKSYKKLVELIKNPDMVPILNHCTAGKDRTGVACAIILMILGVSREDIIEDYLKSNEYSKESIEYFLNENPYAKKLFKQLEDEGIEIPVERLNYVFGVNEYYIKEMFRRIDEDYKSIESYLNIEFGLNEVDIKNIRDNYLE